MHAQNGDVVDRGGGGGSRLDHSRHDLTSRYVEETSLARGTVRGGAPPPGQALYTISRAVSSQDVQTAQRGAKQSRGDANVAYVHAGGATSPTLVKLQPTGYYLASETASVRGTRRDRRWSAGSEHRRAGRGGARAAAHGDATDGRAMYASRASTVATAFSGDSRTDSTFVRWSPSMQRHHNYVDGADDVFVAPHGEQDNRSAKSFVIATNHHHHRHHHPPPAAGAHSMVGGRTGRKHAKAYSLPPGSHRSHNLGVGAAQTVGRRAEAVGPLRYCRRDRGSFINK